VNEALSYYSILRVEFEIERVIWLVLAGVKLFALGDALIRKNEYYVAAEKQTKMFWALLLSLSVAFHGLDYARVIGILSLIGNVIAFVYLADVRPILRSMQRR
jgi:hypothetical protein